MAPTNNINKQWFAGGVDALYVGFYDSDGIFVGGNGTLARADVSWMRRWQAVKTLATEVPERNRVTITGDDRPQGFLTFDRTDSPTAAVQVGSRDQDLESQMVGLSDYARNQYRALLFDPKLSSTAQLLGIIGHSQAKSNEYGTVQQSGWEIIDLWKGEVTPGAPSGLEEQTGHAYDFTFTMERQSNYPDNVALSIANEGTDQSSGNVFGSKYRLIRGAFKGDGTMTVINMPQTPAADDTDTDIYAVEITKRTTAGVVSILTPTSGYTVSVANKQITLASAALYDEIYTVNLLY